MNKFLKLVENHLPVKKDNDLGKMTDKLAELLDTIDSVTVTSTTPATELTIDIDGHIITLEVKDVKTNNDGSTFKEAAFNAPTYSVDKNVEDLATKAEKGAFLGRFGSAASQAKSAVKRREDVVKKAVPIYDKVTQALSNAITQTNKTLTTSNIGTGPITQN